MRSGHTPAHRPDWRVKPGEGGRRVSNPRSVKACLSRHAKSDPGGLNGKNQKSGRQYQPHSGGLNGKNQKSGRRYQPHSGGLNGTNQKSGRQYQPHSGGLNGKNQKSGRRYQQRVRGAHRARQDTEDVRGHPPRPVSPPVVWNLSCHWSQVDAGRESEVDIAQLSLTFTQPTRKSSSSPHPHLPQVLWRWASDGAAGVDTLEAVAADLDTGGSGHMVVFFWILTAAGGNPITAVKTTRRKKIKLAPINFGAWNVRTLLNNAQANRPERRTALVLVGRELARYNVDTTALSVTRFAEDGQLRKLPAVYTFCWSGRAKEDRREAGVGFAVKNALVSKLTSLRTGVNDRLMTLKLTSLRPGVNDRLMTLKLPLRSEMGQPSSLKNLKSWRDGLSTSRVYSKGHHTSTRTPSKDCPEWTSTTPGYTPTTLPEVEKAIGQLSWAGHATRRHSSVRLVMRPGCQLSVFTLLRQTKLRWAGHVTRRSVECRHPLTID
ncbi:endonuclease/Exonuclease/phosphatase family [Elysia marginata]|uniref:Endonuclease/Exonuclease/phosphatase family n=1 Tax=Elysia marginata TaxID=1093978 RepID=A0AAV4I262_9GAST|nr:endonuclease/Exonuclease/phosphatase family [Elysia marginata]